MQILRVEVASALDRLIRQENAHAADSKHFYDLICSCCSVIRRKSERRSAALVRWCCSADESVRDCWIIAKRYIADLFERMFTVAMHPRSEMPTNDHTFEDHETTYAE